jgi:putative hydrolase of the HAD superfamily
MIPQLDRYRAVIFDFDQTLVNSSLGMAAGLERVSEACYQLIKPGMVSSEGFTRYLRILAERMDRNHVYDRNIWWQKSLAKFAHLKPEKKLLDCLTNTYWKSVIERTLPWNDTFDTLEYLIGRGYRLGIVTDTDGVRGMKRRRIASVGLDSYVEAIVVAGEDTIEVKPDPKPFLLVCQMLNVTPDKSIYVGDKPLIDTEGAQRAGMSAILLRRNRRRTHVTATATIKQLNELKLIL